MTSPIVDLWAEEEVPVKDALYFAAGESVAAELAPGSGSGVRFLEPFDLEAELREDPENVTKVDIFAQVPLTDGGRLVCGDGAWGSDGYFARLTEEEEPLWLMFFQFSNPFVEITLNGRYATFWSTSAVTITVDIDDPRNTPGEDAE
jgi:hypothetical protein